MNAQEPTGIEKMFQDMVREKMVEFFDMMMSGKGPSTSE